MALTRTEVEHVALLSRLELTDAELERMTDQLNSIIEHFAALGALDTTGVEPTSHVVPLQNIWRDDVVQPSLPIDDVLALAPDRIADLFRVPRVVE